MDSSDSSLMQRPAYVAWPYLTTAELSHCFGPGELEDVKDFAHRTGRDYLTATRVLLGERRVAALLAVLTDAGVASGPRDQARELMTEIRGQWMLVRA